ncbi:hypothetical protein D1B32_04735 [Oceanobacillus profundus]|uniref:Uncharacterized protein n=1 Tax=Oceanobacillus profundus TaxID=372463 RepID=A0A417YME4_9BACI|nr:hypothetical protein D1B32_04735 [Oceanobacillus profundus]
MLLLIQVTQQNKNSFERMIKIIIPIIILIALCLILWFFKINTSYVIPNLIEWATKFILSWITLYWIIRLVKSIEKIK